MYSEHPDLTLEPLSASLGPVTLTLRVSKSPDARECPMCVSTEFHWTTSSGIFGQRTVCCHDAKRSLLNRAHLHLPVNFPGFFVFFRSSVYLNISYITESLASWSLLEFNERSIRISFRQQHWQCSAHFLPTPAVPRYLL